MPAQAQSVCAAEHRGIAGTEFAARLALGDELGDDDAADPA